MLNRQSRGHLLADQASSLKAEGWALGGEHMLVLLTYHDDSPRLEWRFLAIHGLDSTPEMLVFLTCFNVGGFAAERWVGVTDAPASPANQRVGLSELLGSAAD